MATADDVYRTFGQVAELAQLVETGLGTVLLSLDALETGVYTGTRPAEARRLLLAVDRSTLGRTIHRLRGILEVTDELEAILVDALEKRNFLTHHFFRHHGLGIHSEEGRARMVRHLEDEIGPALHRAYVAADQLSDILVAAVQLKREVHDAETAGEDHP